MGRGWLEVWREQCIFHVLWHCVTVHGAPAATVKQSLSLCQCHTLVFNAGMQEGMLIATCGQLDERFHLLTGTAQDLGSMQVRKECSNACGVSAHWIPLSPGLACIHVSCQLHSLSTST